MPDFNPKDMDALFREGADRLEFEYNPDAWVLMEAKLDKKAKRRRIIFYFVGLFFLIAAIATSIIIDINNQNDPPQITKTVVSKTLELQDQLRDKEKEDVVSEQKTTAVYEAETESTKEYISFDSKERSGNIGAQNSFQSGNTGNLMGHEIVSIDSQNGTGEVEEDIQSANILEENAIISEVLIEPTLEKELIEVTSINNRKLQLLESKAFDLKALDLKVAPTNTNTSILQPSNRWTFTVFANPEWSSVGLLKESKAGWSVGVKFGYQFADKFEVSAGLAYSRKIYKGGGEAFTMAGGWYDDIEPMQMDAKCDVIEIPIGLSYHLNGFRNSGFFADVGINSYMLHSEWYGFEYNDALVRPPRYMEVNEEGQNSHLIGVGRIAIGYQKILSRNAAIQVAPYLQFPLTGIGAGQVNVYSTGVQLAVKFNTQ